jgi:signal transduction histidine kinase/tetratricopeptide (TPR) repeat protein
MSAALKSFFLVCLLGIGCTRNLSAQSATTLDSLNAQLQGSLSDSVRILVLIATSQEYQYSDLQKSFDFAEQAIKLAEEKNLPWGKARAYKNIGNFYSVRGDFTTAIKYQDLALTINYQLRDSTGITACYINLGTNYSSLGKYDEAYFYLTQSYRVANTTGNQLQRAISLHNIATVFKELKQYERSFDYFKLSMKISNEINDLEGGPYNFNEIGDLYLHKGQYDSALAALTLSLKLTRQRRLKINDLEPSILTNIAKTYLHQNDPATAMSYYDSAYSIYLNTGNKFGLADVGLGRGLVYMKERKYEAAQKLIEQSATVAHQLKAWKLEIQCYENLSVLYEHKGDYQKSLAYFKQHQQLKDSLFSEGMQSKLLKDQILFETETKEAQIKSLIKMEDQRKNEIKRKELIQNILVVAIALTGIMLFTVYRSGQRRIRINKLLLEHQGEMKKRSVELEELNKVKDKFFSIISHDLRSPMNALSGILNLMDKDHVTPEEFSRLSKELRVQFDHTKTLINNLLDWALLQMDKLKIQQEKIDLRALGDSNATLVSSLNVKQVKIINQIEANTLALGDTNMINLVIRNLLMNAIKFSEAGALVEMSAKEEGENYIVSIKDHGVGISPEVQKLLFEKTSGYSTRGTANEKGTGLGLILCKEFVERNGGKIWLESEIGKGSTFHFTVKKA